MATERATRGRPLTKREQKVVDTVPISSENDTIIGDDGIRRNRIELIPGHSQFHLGQIRKLYPEQQGYKITVNADGTVSTEIPQDKWLEARKAEQETAIEKSKTKFMYSGQGYQPGELKIKADNQFERRRYVSEE